MNVGLSSSYSLPTLLRHLLAIFQPLSMNASCSPCTPLSAPKSLTEFSLPRYATQHLFLVNSLLIAAFNDHVFLYVSLNSPQIEPSSSLLIYRARKKDPSGTGEKRTLNYRLAAKRVAMTFVSFVLGGVPCLGDKFH